MLKERSLIESRRRGKNGNASGQLSGGGSSTTSFARRVPHREPRYEEAARVLGSAARRVDRDRYAAWWAAMQVRWGAALFDMGTSGGGTQSIASLRAAVTTYLDALHVYTRGSHPHDWARTQNNLGGCLLESRRAAERD